jgi:membrane-bound lytic murein transglycosylase D
MEPRRFNFLLTLAFLMLSGSIFAQIPQVPSEMEFADLLIRINPQARREIQLDVDALYRNPTYFKLKQDRVNLYMPIIERELRSNGVPLDLKYLAIQESGLIPDAVSTSNAVGFWQFKQGTAEEVGLRVDAQVDERKNIITSTRGAAKYLKKQQSVMDNWMTAVVAYQMGLGGAKSYFGNQFSGVRVVEIDRNSHWYFKKFLAHKVAYEGQIGVFASNQRLAEVQIQGPTTFSALAKRFGVSEDHLKEFNKWAVNGRVPAGSYTLFYIASGSLPVQPAITQTEEKPKTTTSQSSAPEKNSPAYKQANSYPKINGNTTKANQPNQITVNDLDGVQASKTTSQSKFADEIGLKERKFRKLNDMDEEERVENGKYYYTEKKKTAAEVETHVVQPGESLWSISQKYGIRLSSLKSKNRIRKDSELKAGMVLNLREPRKRGEEIPVVQLTPPKENPRTVITESEPVKEVAPVETKPETQIRKTEVTSNYHTVSQGETLFSISKRHGVTVDQLKTWNSIGSQNIISIGQKLIIFKP